MADYRKIAAIVASLLSLSILARMLILALPSIAIAAAAYALGTRKQKSCKASEIVNFSRSVRENYARSGSLRNAIARAANSDYTFSGLVCRLMASYSMGGSFYDQNLSHKWATGITPELGGLLSILSEGLSQGKNIVPRLAFLEKTIEDAEWRRNSIISKVEGMEAVSRMGTMFFFPMFSGISAAIIGSASMAHADPAAAARLGAVSIAYILIVSLIHSSLSKGVRSAYDVLYKAMPTIVTAAILFFLTSNFLAKMI
ncbi:MAG: hypothetical protein ACP5K9_01555 [Candidatus Micrarchaeia archaeon]